MVNLSKMTRVLIEIKFIWGTPGVGKSRICAEIVKHRPMKWQDVSQIAKDCEFIQEYDETYECPVLDEDRVSFLFEFIFKIIVKNITNCVWINLKLLDHLEPQMESGGNIVEYHSCDFFPERWFDAVFVILCDNTILYDRLQQRGYNQTKIKENIECEIFQMTLNEAKESYDETIVVALSGESESDFVDSIKQITEFIDNFRK